LHIIFAILSSSVSIGLEATTLLNRFHPIYPSPPLSLLERRYGIAAYDYWKGYSAAQIDLMVLDSPVIDYGIEKKTGLGNSAADVRDMDDLADAWAKRKSEEVTIIIVEFTLHSEKQKKSDLSFCFSLVFSQLC
jgi:hypothetical protein